MKPKILIGPPLPPALTTDLQDHLEVVKPDALAEVEGLLGLTPTPEMLDDAPRLRAISTISAGYDAFDVPDLTRRGILLMNCPDALTETTADLAFALLLAAARRVVELDRYVRDSRWTGGIGEELFGVDVHGKTLGIVGLGRIGAAVARRGALGFGMRVLYTGPSRKPEAERIYGARRCDLDDLLGRSDFVCLTFPLRPGTERLIGPREFALMKPSAILVNVARGRILDEAALIHALQAGDLRAAGLDVFEHEPLAADSPHLALPNVVALPHIGSATHQTRDAMAASATRNLIDFLVHGTPQNAVNPEALRP